MVKEKLVEIKNKSVLRRITDNLFYYEYDACHYIKAKTHNEFYIKVIVLVNFGGQYGYREAI